MALYIDNVEVGTAPYTPVTAGLITCEEDMWALRSSAVDAGGGQPIPDPIDIEHEGVPVTHLGETVTL